MSELRTNPKAKTAGRSGSRHQPEQTRAAILDAALVEFAEHGINGARTDAIAAAAGVNKALLYYYFEDKEMLYGAVLDGVFSGLYNVVTTALQQGATPREKLLTYIAAHCDYVAHSPFSPRLVQREMMRSGRNLSPHLRRILDFYLRPMLESLERVVREGIDAGEFRPGDPAQIVTGIVALIVFYYTSTPLAAAISGQDPLSPDRTAAHKQFVLSFVSNAVLVGNL